MSCLHALFLEFKFQSLWKDTSHHCYPQGRRGGWVQDVFQKGNINTDAQMHLFLHWRQTHYYAEQLSSTQRCFCFTQWTKRTTKTFSSKQRTHGLQKLITSFYLRKQTLAYNFLNRFPSLYNQDLFKRICKSTLCSNGLSGIVNVMYIYNIHLL